ncbi:DUF305 domain-containing protein [Leptolyngbya sp. GGD]|uniref:DUF305 domain-containing protein n=1 Tax=Leptolyngbya sp. GGD TaxID=2997907 RepID=UPI00227CEBF6|nr:DUF305 domain-containing protein [Leptolyngbya sp. GGD]MCY6491206.1 DUF305 domain-containing protein [Leptolyngbya sp. GGD]
MFNSRFLRRSLKSTTTQTVVGIVAIATLAACSTTTGQNSATNSSPAASTMPGMDHSNMDHGSMNHGNMMMDLGPADANFDLRFIDAMTPHHQGAVEMAKEAQQKSKRPEIKKLAADIIKAQDQEIGEMKQWRQAWYPKANSIPMAYDSKMGQMMPMSADQMKGMMMGMDLGAADKQFDLRFINAMIPHHEGAVTMAQDALSKSKRPEIKKLAQEIIASQEKEIAQMKQWRKAWYNQ